MYIYYINIYNIYIYICIYIIYIYIYVGIFHKYGVDGRVLLKLDEDDYDNQI
jgi:hypothetical protein